MTEQTTPRVQASGGRWRWLAAVPVLVLTAGVLAGVGQANQADPANQQNQRDRTAAGRAAGRMPAVGRDLGSWQTEPGVYPGYSQPSSEIDLAFAHMGKIAEVSVEEGDQIQPGQVLIRQDITADEARLKALQIKADVVARVKLAETQLKQAEVEHERMANAAPTAYSTLERERARLEVEAAGTRIVEENRQGLAAEAEAQEQQVIIQHRVLQTPEPGIVQKVEAAVGEVFGPETPALRVVRIDPLYVEVIEAPAEDVRRLKVGDAVQVRLDAEGPWVEARVNFIDPVGNAASGTLPFRLELPNPDGRPAGMRVQVKLPEAAEAGAGGGQQAAGGGA